MENDKFLEFSSKIAKSYGIEIALMLSFFRKCYSLVQGNESPSYPTVSHTMQFFNFWNEDKIRNLISELYLKKLI